MKKTYGDAVGHFKKTISYSVFIDLFEVALTLGLASIIGNFSNAIFNRDTEYVVQNLWYLIACVLINVIIVPLICYWGDTICIKEAIKYDVFMFYRFLNLPYEKSSKIPIGEVKARLESDVIMFRNSIILIITKAITVPLALAGIIFLMANINIIYMLVTVALSLIVLIVPYFTKRLSAKYDDETRQYQAQESALCYDLIILAPFIKLYRLGKTLLSEYRSVFDDFRNKTQKKAILLKSLCENVSAVLAVLSNILVLIFGAYFLSIKLISAGDILAMAGFYTALLTSMENIGFIISRSALLKKLEERVAFFYDRDATIALDNTSAGLIPLTANKVSYSIDGKCILKPISFKIYPHQKVAIIGKNGTGKTTLLNIITGLYKTYDGSIAAENVELKELSDNVLSEKYSFVSQSPFVFKGTVRENILLGCDTEDREKTDHVMKAVGIYDINERVVNTKADNLSGGELQRISLARALLRDRPVIIMDEPSNHLDHTCIEWIKEYIKTCNKTILYVTHDKDLIASADAVIDLDNNQ